jgi:hypothetical protein
LCRLVKSRVAVWAVIPTVAVLPCHLKTLCLLQVAVHAFNKSQNSESLSTVTIKSRGDINDTVVTLPNTYIINDDNPYPFIMPLRGNTSWYQLQNQE